MRFKRKKKSGRVIERFFAFFPIRIGDEVRWLEMVNIKYKYENYHGGRRKKYKIEFVDDEK